MKCFKYNNQYMQFEYNFTIYNELNYTYTLI